MLIDLKNESEEEEHKDFTIVLDDKTSVDIGAVKEGCTVIGIKPSSQKNCAKISSLIG